MFVVKFVTFLNDEWRCFSRSDGEFLFAGGDRSAEVVEVRRCMAGDVPRVGHAHLGHAPLRARYQPVLRHHVAVEIQGKATASSTLACRKRRESLWFSGYGHYPTNSSYCPWPVDCPPTVRVLLVSFFSIL